MVTGRAPWFSTPRVLVSVGIFLTGISLMSLTSGRAGAYFAGWLVGIGTCSLCLLLMGGAK